MRRQRTNVTTALYVPALGRSLPVLLDVWPATGELLGMSRFQTYEAVKRQEIPSFRIGGRIKVPTAVLLDRLGIDIATSQEAAPERSTVSTVA